MDFIEAKRMAAREIALALGVPSMLLGIPGAIKMRPDLDQVEVRDACFVSSKRSV